MSSKRSPRRRATQHNNEGGPHQPTFLPVNTQKGKTMTKPQRAPLRERIAPDPNGTHHTTDLGAHTGQVVRHPKQGRELSGKVVAPAPRALTQVETDRRYAEVLARSGMLPDTYKNNPSNVVWAIGYARDLDMPISSVLGNVYLSQGGKPAMTTAFMAALVRRPGHKLDRKSTRLNSSHVAISYAVFCLKKKIKQVSIFN